MDTRDDFVATSWAVDGIVVGNPGFPALVVDENQLPAELNEMLTRLSNPAGAEKYALKIMPTAPYGFGFTDAWDTPILCTYAAEQRVSQLPGYTVSLALGSAFPLARPPSAVWLNRVQIDGSIILCAYSDIFLASYVSENEQKHPNFRFVQSTGFGIAQAIHLR